VKINGELMITDHAQERFFFMEEKEFVSSVSRVNTNFFWNKKVIRETKKTCEFFILNRNSKMITKECDKITFRVNSTLFIKSGKDNEILIISPKIRTLIFMGSVVKKFDVKGTSKITVHEKGRIIMDEFEVQFPATTRTQIMKELKLEKIKFPTLNVSQQIPMPLSEIPTFQEKLTNNSSNSEVQK
jgi:hypothetical protein